MTFLEKGVRFIIVEHLIFDNKKEIAVSKKMLYLLLAGLFCLGVYGNAFANGSYAEMVEDTGSFVAQNSFGWNETPWLHLHISEQDASWYVSGTFWQGPNSEYFFTGSNGVSEDIWLSLDSGLDSSNNPVSWDTVKQLGDWTVDGTYVVVPNFRTGNYSTSYTVTPEPISCVLFLLGGGSLAFSRFKKRFV